MTPLVFVAALSMTAQMKFAATGFTGVGMDTVHADFYTEQFSLAFLRNSADFSVITKGDIAATLGMERQRQLLGCEEKSTSCLAELAGALGVDGLIIGNVAAIGKKYALNVKIVDAATAKTIFAEAVTVNSEDQLLDAITNAANRAAIKLLGGKVPTPPANSTSSSVDSSSSTAGTSSGGYRSDAPPPSRNAATAAPVETPQAQTSLAAATTAPTQVVDSFHAADRTPPRSPAPWAIMGVGIALGGLSVMFAVFSANNLEAINRINNGNNNTTTPFQDAFQAKQAGQFFNGFAWTLGTIGGAMTVSGLLWGLLTLPKSKPTPVSFVPTPGGAAMVWSGTLP